MFGIVLIGIIKFLILQGCDGQVPQVDISFGGDLCNQYTFMCIPHMATPPYCDAGCTYEWFLDDVDITTSPPTAHHPNGANLTVTTSNVSVSGAPRTYQCFATNAQGRSLDTPISKSVMAGFTSIPSADVITALPGDDIEMTWEFTFTGCVAMTYGHDCDLLEIFLYAGFSQIAYINNTYMPGGQVMYYNGYNSTNTPITITSSAASDDTVVRLDITNVATSDGGIYAIAYLEKHRPPFFHACNKDTILFVYGVPTTPVINPVSAPENGNTTLYCQSNSTSMPEDYRPALDCYWIMDGVNITANPPDRHTIVQDRLYVSELTQDDSDIGYTCVCSEAGGLTSDESNITNINVLYDINFYDIRPVGRQVTVNPGPPVYLSVSISANPFPSVTRDNWVFTPEGSDVGQELPPDIDVVVVNQERLYLLVDSVTVDHYGTYTLSIEHLMESFTVVNIPEPTTVSTTTSTTPEPTTPTQVEPEDPEPNIGLLAGLGVLALIVLILLIILILMSLRLRRKQSQAAEAPSPVEGPARSNPVFTPEEADTEGTSGTPQGYASLEAGRQRRGNVRTVYDPALNVAPQYEAAEAASDRPDPEHYYIEEAPERQYEEAEYARAADPDEIQKGPTETGEYSEVS